MLLYARGAGQPTARQGKSSGPQPLYQIVVTVWPAYSGSVIFYESTLLATVCLNTYEELLMRNCMVNVLYVAF